MKITALITGASRGIGKGDVKKNTVSDYCRGLKGA